MCQLDYDFEGGPAIATDYHHLDGYPTLPSTIPAPGGQVKPQPAGSGDKGE